MMPIIVNMAHVAETGCVLDGVFGWHNDVRMLLTAEEFGWEIDDELREIMDRYDAGDSEYGSSDPEIIHDAMREAEDWLNDNTLAERKRDGKPCFWHGQWYTDDGDAVPDDEVQRYVWHWHDGSFFLSPICDDEENCDDDTCAHHD
jgi:hypothetical protein